MHVPDTAEWGWKDADTFGPIYERKYVNLRVTYVSGPDLVAEVNDDTSWDKFLGVPLQDLRSIAGDGLFTAETTEPNWAAAHAVLAPAFTQSAMRTYHGVITDTVDRLVQYWREQGPDTWLNVAPDMNNMALEVIGRVAFGYDFDSFARAEPHVMVASLLRSMKYVNRAAYSFPAAEATVFRKQREQHRRDVATIHRFIDDIVATRKSAVHDSDRRDLLDLMLDTTDPATGQRLSDQNIRDQILTFLLAGQETSAGVLAFALHYLSTRPEVADRVRDEIAEVCGSGPIEFEQVGKLRYLRKVVDETLRLWPVAPGYFRKAKHDTMIGGQYPFDAGEWVFVVLLKLHRDPSWGPDAETFDPDRWNRDRVPKNLAAVYKPFGTGMRACIGRQFAYHEIVLTLATVLRTFELEPEPGYELVVEESVSIKPGGLRIKVR
ncbi:cytochrome P450 [Rhodococcoides trifolii]|uniref:Cytochrome P450 n=2 Tax=Rhodococcoides trifolii TaxID=908250 RepID=A0A917CXY9_9NOCA|nr:cytochrome P450 [Rhodococcus trifolii]